MWTPATRKNYSRNGLRYQSDVTDEEWRVIEPYLPPAKGIGRPRGWPLREIVNGIFYVMRSGCPWRQLPKDLPPWSTVSSPPRPASSSKSSPRARIRSALLFCRADGWSSGSLPGSAATEGLPKISRPASDSARAFLYAASVMLLSRRIARHA